MFSQTCKLEKKILVAGKEKKGEWTREPQRERERAREPQTEKKEVRRMAQAHALIAAGDGLPKPYDFAERRLAHSASFG